MFILIKNQEGESMNLLSQNTDFNALLAAMKTDIEAEYEKATGYAIDLDEDSGSDYEVGINVEDSAADGFCLASGYINNPALTSPLVIDGACRATRKPG